MSTLQVRLQDALVATGTQLKSIRTLVNGNAADNTALITTAKGNLVAAVNEVKAQANALAAAGGATINDAASASTVQTYSITKILAEIEAARAAVKAELLGGAGPAYDTLQELKTLLDGAGTDLSALTTALGNRVRFDAAQSLTAPQKAQANANIGSASLVQIGDPDTDLVAILQAAL